MQLSVTLFTGPTSASCYVLNHALIRLGDCDWRQEQLQDWLRQHIVQNQLLKEHVTLKPPNKVIFDFLGKDSIRFYDEVEVDQQLFKNLMIFKKTPKTDDDEIFDRLTVRGCTGTSFLRRSMRERKSL